MLMDFRSQQLEVEVLVVLVLVVLVLVVLVYQFYCIVFLTVGWCSLDSVLCTILACKSVVSSCSRTVDCLHKFE